MLRAATVRSGFKQEPNILYFSTGLKWKIMNIPCMSLTRTAEAQANSKNATAAVEVDIFVGRDFQTG